MWQAAERPGYRPASGAPVHVQLQLQPPSDEAQHQPEIPRHQPEIPRHHAHSEMAKHQFNFRVQPRWSLAPPPVQLAVQPLTALQGQHSQYALPPGTVGRPLVLPTHPPPPGQPLNTVHHVPPHHLRAFDAVVASMGSQALNGPSKAGGGKRKRKGELCLDGPAELGMEASGDVMLKLSLNRNARVRCVPRGAGKGLSSQKLWTKYGRKKVQGGAANR